MGRVASAIVDFSDSRRVLRFRGDEDRTTQGCRRRALTQAIRSKQNVLVDLTELSFADSSLMLDLAVLARRLRAHGGEILLHGAQPQIQPLLEISGLLRMPGVRLEAPAALA